MATQFGVGLSQLEDSYQAGAQAAESALTQFETIDNCLALVFASVHYDHNQLLQAVSQRIPTPNLIGLTVAGVFDAYRLQQHGVIIAVLQGDGMQFLCASQAHLSDDLNAAGENLGALFTPMLQTDNRHALQLLFPDGLTNTVSSMVDALFGMIGSRSKYIGGASGDNFCFVETSQYHGDQVLKDALVGGLIMSDKPIAVDAAHGWQPISPPMIVTRAEQNLIHELDWQPAFDAYRDFALNIDRHDFDLTGFAEYSSSHPFGIPLSKQENKYIVRDPISTTKEGSIACVGDIPVNSVLRVLRGDRDSLLAAVRSAAQSVMRQLQGESPVGVLVISCASRSTFLGDQFNDEIAAIREVVGANVPVCGCLTYGEIGTIGNGPPEFHNKTITLCAFPH